MTDDLQKASMWKRISAGLFDGILLAAVAVLCAWLISVAVNYDARNQALADVYARYEEAYGVDFNAAVNAYDSLSEEEIAQIDTAYAALSADENALYAYEMLLRLTLIIVTLGILLAYVIMEFTIPMLLGNGQTFGKKIFGIGLMHQDFTQIKGTSLFIRTILGKYTIETMIPVLLMLMMAYGAVGIVGPAIILVLLVVEIVMIIATRTNALIHDQISSTVCVDIASQRIFATREDLIAFKQRMHADKASRQPY